MYYMTNVITGQFCINHFPFHIPKSFVLAFHPHRFWFCCLLDQYDNDINNSYNIIGNMQNSR